MMMKSKTTVASKKKVTKKALLTKNKSSSKKKEVKKEDDKSDFMSFFMKNITKTYGDDVVLKLTADMDLRVPVAFKSGIPPLDDNIGIGGYPKDRIIEIFGPESSGKTTLALHAVAECQKLGGVAYFIDVEHALDLSYAKKIGVNIEKLLVSQPSSGEQALRLSEDFIQQKKKFNFTAKPSCIIVDSVAALAPQKEIDGEIGEVKGIGEQARLMSKALRKLCAILSNSNTVLIFINQIRTNISTGPYGGGGNTTPGGKALKFYSSVRINTVRIGNEKLGEEVIGNKTLVKIVKNKVAAPFKEFECVIRFGVGFDLFKMKLDQLLKVKGVEKPLKGGWVTLPDGRKFCGYVKWLAFYEENTEYIEGLLKGVDNEPSLG